MEVIALLIISFQVLLFIGMVVLLVYVLAKRLKAKKKETFEKRTN
ncbi:MAG: hypothetical protein P8N52_05830 [Crocinitomicaceae bacterium]|nr:hypothetical protein [Crocinitomicaceae bacterium]